MQLVIELEENVYDAMKNCATNTKHRSDKHLLGILWNSIVNGTPLPKHGDLKDYDTLDDTVVRLNSEGWQITRNEYKLIDRVVFEMPTLIETDEE